MADSVRTNVTIVQDHLPAVIASLPLLGGAAARAYCETAMWEAKAIVPVRTGHLKGSIAVEQTGPMDYETYTEVNYARFVEWGTRYMRAQPFMAPAAQAAMADIPSIGNKFGRGVEEAAITGRIQR